TLPSGALSAAGTGVGAITVASYSSNPTPGAVSGGTGTYYDVALNPASTFASVTVTVCDLGSGRSITWWNGTEWVPFSLQSYSGATGCVTATVSAFTSPTLAQLSGTPVAVSADPTSGYWEVASDGGIFSYG